MTQFEEGRFRQGLIQFIFDRTKESFSESDDLFASGLINSLFALDLIAYVEDQADIEVTSELLSSQNFRTIDSIVQMASLMARHGGERVRAGD